MHACLSLLLIANVISTKIFWWGGGGGGGGGGVLVICFRCCHVNCFTKEWDRDGVELGPLDLQLDFPIHCAKGPGIKALQSGLYYSNNLLSIKTKIATENSSKWIKLRNINVEAQVFKLPPG